MFSPCSVVVVGVVVYGPIWVAGCLKHLCVPHTHSHTHIQVPVYICIQIGSVALMQISGNTNIFNVLWSANLFFLALIVVVVIFGWFKHGQCPNKLSERNG